MSLLGYEPSPLTIWVCVLPLHYREGHMPSRSLVGWHKILPKSEILPKGIKKSLQIYKIYARIKFSLQAGIVVPPLDPLAHVVRLALLVDPLDLKLLLLDLNLESA